MGSRKNSKDVRVSKSSIPALASVEITVNNNPDDLSRSSEYNKVSLSSRSQFPKENIQESRKPKGEFKNLTWEDDSYEGSVLAGNLHGHGFYFCKRNGQKYFYDGLFYVNKLEGYSQVFYENGTHFQGLFKEHLRYGPGILTYRDGSQDAGFWSGFKLIRLACVIGDSRVPTIANTTSGKTKLLGHRCMIPLCEETTDILKEVLEHTEHTGENEAVLAKSDELFNKNIRNMKSLFFHKKFFDDAFFGGQDCLIKVIIDNKESVTENRDKYNEGIEDTVLRANNLKSKINEVNESLESFSFIKKNLERRVNMCLSCCKSESLSFAEETSPGTPQPNPSEKADYKSIGGDTIDAFMLDDSLDSSEDFSSDIQDITSEKNWPTEITLDVCSCDEEAEPIDDLGSLEEQLQNIITQETYHRNIRDELQKKLNTIMMESESKKLEDLRFKYVEVKEMWAWNNEESMINMQKHCFKHRNSENMVNFSVPNLIFGNRDKFGTAGEHEILCQKFLIACSKGRKDFVKECLWGDKVHPNISDAKGNSAIFFAVAKNQYDIISLLTNSGAKLDQLNDEQLTPLSMALLRYICLKNKCIDWEKAFLPEVNPEKLPEMTSWYKVKSFLSLKSENSSGPSSLQNSEFHCSDLRIIDLFLRIPSFEHARDTLEKSKTPYVFDLSYKSYVDATNNDESMSENEDELKNTFVTIMTLLDFGANPDISKVPYPPLVISLFSGSADLVKEVIKANADINVLIEENLSCLHIIASIYPCERNANICATLVRYGCNPNQKTLPSHWANRRQYFLGNIPKNAVIEDNGKNALHLLCMRTDHGSESRVFFYRVAQVLLNTNLDTKSTYLGHTYLSLAVLSGNMDLAKCILETNVFDPHQPLEYGMGNVLTLYGLKRFENNLPLETCKEMLTGLIDCHVNILHPVGDAENSIAFVEDETDYFEKFAEKDDTKKGKEKEKPKAKKMDKQKAAIVDYMKNLGRQTIINQIQIDSTRILYDFIDEDKLEDYEIMKILAQEYLTPKILLKNLKSLFEKRKYYPDRLNRDMIKDLLIFVNIHKKVVKKPPIKAANKAPIDKRKANKESTEPKEPLEENMEDLANNFDVILDSLDAPKGFLIIPGLDNLAKYQVCFHCLRGKDKLLRICPRCQMVRFCSAQCNKLNVKLKTQHGCNIIFYDMTESELDEISKGVCLDELDRKNREALVERWTKIRENLLLKEEEKLLEMWRKDEYGTHFLKLKPLLERAISKRSNSKVNGECASALKSKSVGKKINWNLSLLKNILERNFHKSPGDTDLYTLENLIMKLHNKHKQTEATIHRYSKQHSISTRRSTLGDSTLHSVMILDKLGIPEDALKSCSCSKKAYHSRIRPSVEKSGTKKKTQFKNINPEFASAADDASDVEFKQVSVVQKSVPFVKRLKVVPERYRKFIQVVGTYFPDIDLSQWLLPYACCNDGQLYYKFCTDGVFKESYSFS